MGVYLLLLIILMIMLMLVNLVVPVNIVSLRNMAILVNLRSLVIFVIRVIHKLRNDFWGSRQNPHPPLLPYVIFISLFMLCDGILKGLPLFYCMTHYVFLT